MVHTFNGTKRYSVLFKFAEHDVSNLHSYTLAKKYFLSFAIANIHRERNDSDRGIVFYVVEISTKLRARSVIYEAPRG